MARSRGADPDAMTVRDALDLSAWLEAAAALDPLRRRPPSIMEVLGDG